MENTVLWFSYIGFIPLALLLLLYVHCRLACLLILILKLFFLIKASKEKEEKVQGVIEIPSGDASKDDVVKAVSENVKWQMGDDRKTTELKALQGLIWKDAYESKAVKGE